MKFIDLSRELYHRTAPHPSHPPIVIGTWRDQDEFKVAGQSIRKADTVLINMGLNERLWGTPGYATDFPGLHVDAVHWLAEAGVKIFGAEAVSRSEERRVGKEWRCWGS